MAPSDKARAAYKKASADATRAVERANAAAKAKEAASAVAAESKAQAEALQAVAQVKAQALPAAAAANHDSPSARARTACKKAFADATWAEGQAKAAAEAEEAASAEAAESKARLAEALRAVAQARDQAQAAASPAEQANTQATPTVAHAEGSPAAMVMARAGPHKGQWSSTATKFNGVKSSTASQLSNDMGSSYTPTVEPHEGNDAEDKSLTPLTNNTAITPGPPAEADAGSPDFLHR